MMFDSTWQDAKHGLHRLFLSAIAAATLFAPMRSTQAEVIAQPVGLTFYSEDQTITITSDFPGGRMNQCVQIAEREFEITISPEQAPINDSAWYAFQVRSTQPQQVAIRLNYVSGTHRYAPKISRDGKTWTEARELLTSQHLAGREVLLTVDVDDQPLWVAGQELVSTDDVDKWSDRLSTHTHVRRREIGKSVQGRPLHRLDITESKSPDYVFIIARQHPPEVSGAIGMMHFVDAIAEETSLSRKFRQRYNTVVIPTVNPDGVEHGHWRCNANGVDLNRDWGHFTQPETRAVRDQLMMCRGADDQKLCLFVDFHSTFDDVFYRSPRKTKLFPMGFADNWFNAIQKRFPEYRVNDDDNHNFNRTTSKAWVASTLGVNAITYEFGDETGRDVIRDVAGGAAQEMMKLLLQLPRRDKSPEQFVSTEKSSK